MNRFFCVILLACIAGTTSAQSDYNKLLTQDWDQLRHHFDSLKHTTDDSLYTDSLRIFLNYTKANNSPRLESIALFFLAQYYFDNEQLALSTNYFQQGLAVAEKHKLLAMAAQFHLSLGGVMSRFFKKDDELKNYLKAYDIFLQIDTIRAAATQYAITNVYYSIGNYDEAIRHGHVALALFEGMPFNTLNQTGQNNYMSLLNTIGIAYREQKTYDSAIFYLNRSHKIAVMTNNNFWQNLILGNLGSVYLSQKKYDKALVMILQDYKTSLAYDQMESAANAAIGIGQVYFNKHNLNMAKAYYDSAIQIMEAHHITEGRVAYLEHIYQWYEATGHYKQAYEEHKNFIALRDSINAIKNKVECQKPKPPMILTSK